MLKYFAKLAALCCGLTVVPVAAPAAPLVISFEGVLTNVHPIYGLFEDGQRAHGYFVVDPAVPSIEYPPGSTMNLLPGTPLRSRISIETAGGTYFIGADGSSQNGSTWALENSLGNDGRTFTGLSISSIAALGPLVTNFPDMSPWVPFTVDLIAGAYSDSDAGGFLFDPEAGFVDYAAILSTAPDIEFSFSAALWGDGPGILYGAAVGRVTSFSITPYLTVAAPGAVALFGIGLLTLAAQATRRKGSGLSRT